MKHLVTQHVFILPIKVLMVTSISSNTTFSHYAEKSRQSLNAHGSLSTATSAAFIQPVSAAY